MIPRVVHKNRQALETLLKAEQPQKENRTQFFPTAFYVFHLQHHQWVIWPSVRPLRLSMRGGSHIRCNYMWYPNLDRVVFTLNWKPKHITMFIDKEHEICGVYDILTPAPYWINIACQLTLDTLLIKWDRLAVCECRRSDLQFVRFICKSHRLWTPNWPPWSATLPQTIIVFHQGVDGKIHELK